MKSWLFAKDIARIYETDVNRVAKLMASAGVRRREIPGTYTRYLREDVERFFASTVKAGPTDPAVAEGVACG